MNLRPRMKIDERAKMKERFSIRRVSTLASVTTILAAMLLSAIPAASQSKAAPGKAPCIGCSADGKTTPRTQDGHPDLSGYWNGVGGGNAAGTGQFERS